MRNHYPIETSVFLYLNTTRYIKITHILPTFKGGGYMNKHFVESTVIRFGVIYGKKLLHYYIGTVYVLH